MLCPWSFSSVYWQQFFMTAHFCAVSSSFKIKQYCVLQDNVLAHKAECSIILHTYCLEVSVIKDQIICHLSLLLYFLWYLSCSLFLQAPIWPAARRVHRGGFALYKRPSEAGGLNSSCSPWVLLFRTFITWCLYFKEPSQWPPAFLLSWSFCVSFLVDWHCYRCVPC